MNFDAAADAMHRQERARLAAAVTPTPEQLRSMNAAELGTEIAGMWERLGHDIVTSPDAAELVHTMGGRKFITVCANPNGLAPTGSAALRRLRDRVVASSAERGFFFSVRGFTAEARRFAKAAPVQSVNCAQLVRELQRSREGMQLPETYKNVCRQCGDIVQHRLDSDEAKRCGNGHFVAPPMARPEFVKPPQRMSAPIGQPAPASALTLTGYRNMSAKARRRRAIKAHNRRAWASAPQRQHYAAGSSAQIAFRLGISVGKGR
jgi:hypothetical protein